MYRAIVVAPLKTRQASQIEAKPPPACPDCGKPMEHKGGTFGYVHCGWMLLYREGGWLSDGMVVKDRRLTNWEVE